MKNSKVLSLALSAILVAGCSNNFQSSNFNNEPTNTSYSSVKPVVLTKEDIARLDNEYKGFSTKALTISYLLKKLTSLIGSDNGVAKGSLILKELLYAKNQSESVVPFKAMSNANPAFYSTLTSVSAVITQRSIDIPFDVFMGGSNPLSTPNANAATNITTTGFTANWDVVANANSGYVLTIKQGSTTISTINVSGQATNSYIVTGLNSATNYTYTIQAKNGTLLSNTSNSISVATSFNPIIYTTVSTYPSTAAGFSVPTGVVLDSEGNLYIADSSSHKIMKIANDANHTISTYAGSGASGFANGNGTAAKFVTPIALTIDSDDNLYVSDRDDQRVRKIANDANHTVSTIAGNGVYGFADGNGTAAKFGNPYGLTIDPAGNLYITDFYNNRVRKIANDANHTVSTIAGSGAGSFLDGNSNVAQFNNPTAIARDSSGILYIADYGNNKIRKIANDANYTVSTIAGSSQGSSDGNGTLAKFYLPQGITIDSNGNLYVADRGNSKIRKIANDANHTVSTITGTSYGYIDGNISLARFTNPVGITIDSNGVLYIADSGNNKIRKIY